VSFSGSYAVTFRVTNAKTFAPSHWIFAPKPACASPCAAVSFQQRLTTEKTWRKFVLTYKWNGSAYAIASRTQRGIADCRSAAGTTVKTGYDVRSTSTLRPSKTTNGRVTSFTGANRDDYIPNATGRKKGCVAGTYTYALVGVSR
jgi:hypothetical protein